VAPRRLVGEAGTGLLGTLAGVTIFLVLLLVSVQVLFDLYARSAVSAAVFDAARIVAGSDAAASPSAEADAEAGAREELGRYGGGASFRWDVSTEEVRLTVNVRSRSLLPTALASPLGLDVISRGVMVRRGRVR